MDELLSARQRRPSMAKRKKRRIGAFSRRLSLSDLDLRTNAGKLANSIKYPYFGQQDGFNQDLLRGE
jgi:hypothetical protein